MNSCSLSEKDKTEGSHRSPDSDKTQEEERILQTRRQIRHKILIMSGKGGVGKSSVAVGLALSLARRGFKVGLMDVDIHGPDVLRMLGLDEAFDPQHAQFLLPPELFDNLKVISIEVLMRNRDLAVIWRGPLKHQLIRQFLSEVQWGPLDYLIIDSPPGTGDEPMSVAQTIPETQALIVTTPQEISLADVRKSINFCQKINLNIVGLVENMSGYTCPHCGKELPLFRKGGGEVTASRFNVPFLGALPFDPQVVEAADEGRLLLLEEKDSPFFTALKPLVNYLVKVLPPAAPEKAPEAAFLKFAVPLLDGKSAPKLSVAKQFAIFTVHDNRIQDRQTLAAPANIAEVPAWLAELGVTHILAGELSQNAQTLLHRKGMKVVTGLPQEDPDRLVEGYLLLHS